MKDVVRTKEVIFAVGHKNVLEKLPKKLAVSQPRGKYSWPIRT